MNEWISRVASRVDDQWCDKCQRVCCDCHVLHRAELAQARAERDEAYNAALDAAAEECDGVAQTYPSSGADTEWTEAQVCKRRILALKKSGTR